MICETPHSTGKVDATVKDDRSSARATESCPAIIGHIGMLIWEVAMRKHHSFSRWACTLVLLTTTSLAAFIAAPSPAAASGACDNPYVNVPVRPQFNYSATVSVTRIDKVRGLDG